MAVKWSWAFGQETATLLSDDMDWQMTSAITSYVPDNAFTYTYGGSPGRYSLKVNSGADFFLPVQSFTPSGWLTAAIYNDSASWTQNTFFLEVIAGGNGRYIAIYMSNGASSTFALYVDNVLKATFSVPIGNWHYWALQYDMSADPWSGRVFVDGIAVTATFTDAQTAQTTGSYHCEGFSTNSSFPTAGTSYFAQFIVYDDVADAGQTPYYCTRVAPNSDDSTVGTWVPSAGATNIGVTNNDPLDPSTYTQEAIPASGDNVVTEVNNLSTQLGITPGVVLAATNHTYSSGTAVQAFASVRDSGGVYVDGAIFTPDTSDTTYGYATTTAGLTGASTIDCKYEIA